MNWTDYAQAVGSIATAVALVHDVPSRAVRSATPAGADPDLHSCDVMPSTSSGCSGPCTQSVRASGAEAFRRRERSG
jgi:hypothetical protein